jgi:UDP-2,3-diacylglucosamine pyrophosphatase LpxH
METKQRRKIKLAVISDVHLGTFSCHAEELLNYLKSIHPECLVINGDFIDIWQFRKRYWPIAHMKVIQEVLALMSMGTRVYYLTGNHDEMLRKFSDWENGNFILQDKLVLEIDGRKAWFFHGDVFDSAVNQAKFLANLGGHGYDFLAWLNRVINKSLKLIGRPRLTLSKKIKMGIKAAVSHISRFESVIAEIAAGKKYDYVICGHIHHPEIKFIVSEKHSKRVLYLNSGDWIENLSALEYNEGFWSIYSYYADIPIAPLNLDHHVEGEINNVVNIFMPA